MFKPISMDQTRIRDLFINLTKFKLMPYQSTRVDACFNAMSSKNGAINATNAPGKQHPQSKGEISNHRKDLNHPEPPKPQEDVVDHSKETDPTKSTLLPDLQIQILPVSQPSTM